MKLNLSASDVAESLKQRANDDSASTKLSKLIDEADMSMGAFLATCEAGEDEQTTMAVYFAALHDMRNLLDFKGFQYA